MGVELLVHSWGMSLVQYMHRKETEPWDFEKNIYFYHPLTTTSHESLPSYQHHRSLFPHGTFIPTPTPPHCVQPAESTFRGDLPPMGPSQGENRDEDAQIRA